MTFWVEEDLVFGHPRGPRIIGAGEIRAAFESLFANGSLQAHTERIQNLESLAGVVHHQLERVEENTWQGAIHAYVSETNYYQKVPQGWTMMTQNACPSTQQDLAAVGAMPTVLH